MSKLHWKLLCLVAGCIVAGAGQVVAEEVKEIDQRSVEGKAAADQFYVVFQARKAEILKGRFVGHAYVSLGEDDSTALECRARAYGVYPKEGIGWVGPVPAKMVDDTWAKSDFRLIVRVDKQTFDNIDSYRKEYIRENVEGKYELGSRDCVTFTAETAKRLELKVPERKDAMLPASFLQKLLEMN